MKLHSRWAMPAWVLAGVLSVAANAGAQVDPRDVPIVAQPQQRFNSGQDVQPIFEGWTRNDDGSFNFLFGYLNRNYVEQPSVPVGPNNHFSPGSEDRGQPAYFYPRMQRYQFQVRVPATWSRTDELVWSLTVNGSTQKALGWLQPEWEIDVNTITSNSSMGFGRSKAEMYANRAPSVTASASQTTIAMTETLTLTASVTDDELPIDVPERPRQRVLPTFQEPEGAPTNPDNVSSYEKPRAPRNGLAVLWIVYRGPADVSFDPAGFQAWMEGAEGDGHTLATFPTTATFRDPGTYVLRAIASDGMFLTPVDVTVTVTGSR